MATGTGKTFVALQIIWKLLGGQWPTASRKPRILYLADRNILLDQPISREFRPVFGDADWKIEGDHQVRARDLLRVLPVARGRRRQLGLFREYPPDFFDLIVVDECHRGSAREDSSWRAILEYFAPATQLGMTATPLREDNRDTYAYFGAPALQVLPASRASTMGSSRPIGSVGSCSVADAYWLAA